MKRMSLAALAFVCTTPSAFRKTSRRKTSLVAPWNAARSKPLSGACPRVNFELMVKGLQTKGNVNHILYWSRLPDWKNQLLTPNPDTMYFLPFYNTKDVGPMQQPY